MPSIRHNPLQYQSPITFVDHCRGAIWVMDIRIASTSVPSTASDAVVVGIFKGGPSDALEGPAATLDGALDGALTAMRRSGELAGGALETTVVHTLGKLTTPRVVLVGLG